MKQEGVRCLVVGSDGVGKTSLLVKQATGEFPTEHVPTVFQPVEVHNEDIPLKQLTISDSANQETYDRQRLLSYVGTDLVIVCYSVTSPESLEDVGEKWIPEIRRYSTTMPFILVGLKADERYEHQRASKTSTTSTGSRDSVRVSPVDSIESLGDDVMPWLLEHVQEIRIADRKLAKKVAKTEGALAHMECSAKTGQGIEHLFTNVIPKVLTEQVFKKKKKSSLVRRLGKLLHNGNKREGDDPSIETQSTRSN